MSRPIRPDRQRHGYEADQASLPYFFDCFLFPHRGLSRSFDAGEANLHTAAASVAAKIGGNSEMLGGHNRVGNCWATMHADVQLSKLRVIPWALRKVHQVLTGMIIQEWTNSNP